MKKSTLVLICVTIVLLFVSGFATLEIMKKGDSGKTAYIYKGDELIYEIDLESVGEPYTITIEGENGEKNVIEVREGKIGVVSASCPDKLCVEKGFVGDSLLPVICLPNDVMIVVEGTEASEDAKV